MKYRNTFFLVLSHIVCLFIGYSWLHKSNTSNATEVTEQSRQSTAVFTSSSSDSAQLRTIKDWKSGEFSKAWQAMKSGRYSRAERRKIQQNLITQWACVDFLSAAEAVLGEEWDDVSTEGNSGTTLLSSLRPAMRNDIEGVWQILANHDFGVGRGKLLRAWLDEAYNNNPQCLLSHFTELSWRDREWNGDRILSRIYQKQTPPQQEETWKMIFQMPEGTFSYNVLSSNYLVGKQVSRDDLQNQLQQASEAKNPMLAKTLAYAIGQRLVLESPQGIHDRLMDIPSEYRKQALESAWSDIDRYENFGPNHPLSEKNNELRKERILSVADTLIENQAWDVLENGNSVNKIHTLAKINDVAAADWATHLPYQESTVELFHRSVETYLKNDQEGSKNWIASIPNGSWRDRAYGEYSQQALRSHNDLAASQWALAQISDPAFKVEATSWRNEWKKNHHVSDGN